MKIYFARHGEYLNPDNIAPFQLPGFPLTELGEQQAQLQVEKLLSEKIRTLSTSPIERCVETAIIIGNAIHLHPNQNAKLIEIGSPLEGSKKDKKLEFVYELPKHIEGGGESTDVIFERMNSFVSILKLMSKNSSHVIVSHGDPIDIFLISTLKKSVPHTREELKNSGIRNIPMGGLIMLDFSQSGIPKYSEII